MGNVTLLGVDTSKNSFELYGVDAQQKVVLKKSVSRDKFAQTIQALPPCRIVIEACGGSHHWGRRLRSFGHDVKLIAPQKVAPFVQGNKNDANDAKGIVCASLAPEMKFVAIKETWQQDIQALHRIRQRSIRNQTALANEIRGILLEYGISIRKGINHVRGTLPELLQTASSPLSSMLRVALANMHVELLNTTESIERIDVQLATIAKQHDATQRLLEIDGIGVITATAVLAAVCDFSLFQNGRQFAAWIGLTPGHRQTGGKDSKPIMRGITKRGDNYLRMLLIQGSMSVARQAMRKGIKPNDTGTEPLAESDVNRQPSGGLAPCRKRRKATGVASRNGRSRREWLKSLIDEKGIQKAAVAFANKNARTIFAMCKSGEHYNPSHREAA